MLIREEALKLMKSAKLFDLVQSSLSCEEIFYSHLFHTIKCSRRVYEREKKCFAYQTHVLNNIEANFRLSYSLISNFKLYFENNLTSQKRLQINKSLKRVREKFEFEKFKKHDGLNEQFNRKLNILQEFNDLCRQIFFNKTLLFYYCDFHHNPGYVGQVFLVDRYLDHAELDLLNLIIVSDQIQPSNCLIAKEHLIETINKTFEIPMSLRDENHHLTASIIYYTKLIYDTTFLLKKLENLETNSIFQSSLDQKLILSLEPMPILYVCNLSIRQIELNLFSNLRGLTALFLNNNQLDQLKPNSFSHLNNLNLLDLSHNSIATLEQDSFLHLHSLKILNLSNNKLTSLNNSLNNLSKLNYLNLDNNHFREISSHFLFSNSMLEKLSLKNNQIVKIANNAFEKLKKLTDLDLESNQIKEIKNVSFPKSLKALNLKSNFLINKIEEVSFSGLKCLKFDNRGIERKNETEMKELINEALKRVIESGEFNMINNELRVKSEMYLNESWNVIEIVDDEEHVVGLEENEIGLNVMKDLDLDDSGYEEDEEDFSRNKKERKKNSKKMSNYEIIRTVSLPAFHKIRNKTFSFENLI